MPDGNIYSFPGVYDPEFKSVLSSAKMWVKQSWLDELGLKEPQTTDDFYNMLKAFKEKDPNKTDNRTKFLTWVSASIA